MVLALKKQFLRNAMRGRIVTSVVENVAGITSVFSVIYTTRPTALH